MRHASKLTIFLVSTALLGGCAGGGLFKKKASAIIVRPKTAKMNSCFILNMFYLMMVK